MVRIVRVGLVSADALLAGQVRRLVESAGAELVEDGTGVPDVWLRDVGGVPGPAPGAGELGIRGDVPVLDVRRGGARRPPVPAVVPHEDLVLELPADAQPLLRYLGSLVDVPRARTVAVVGARGGVGASTLAAAVARAAARAGVCTALVELDAASGGLDLALGIPYEPGPRWADLRDEQAGFPAEALSAALPRWHAVGVLSGDVRAGPRPVDPGVADAVSALAGAHDLVVLDLPRTGWLRLVPGREGQAGPAADGPPAIGCDAVAVVAACDGRSAMAAAAVRETFAGVDAGLVVRVPGSYGLMAEELAAAASMPLWATMRPERGLAAAAERGEAPGDHRRGAVARTAARLLTPLGIVP